MKKFIISEEERKHIKSLYEQNDNKNMFNKAAENQPKQATPDPNSPVFGVKVLDDLGNTSFNIDVYNPVLKNTNVQFKYKLAGETGSYTMDAMYICGDNKIDMGGTENYSLTDAGKKLFSQYCSKNPETGYDYVSTGGSNSTYA